MTTIERLKRMPGARLAERRRKPALPEPAGLGQTELTERRDRLAGEFAELQWDLGGLVYEMASRDHFRMDVLVRKSAELQQIDADLGAVERLLSMGDAGAAGNCPACGALHARGAVFCSQCGKDLMVRGPVGAKPE